MGIITFTTDFGRRDWFVGTMKGVVLGISPEAVLVDLTHEISPGDIRAGAFSLAAGCRFFPPGTIHVAVVDPGVGSARKAIGVRTSDYFFLGPDNGVLSWALKHETVASVHLLENHSLFRQPLSRTFHGRDLFAPVAAHLLRGVPLREFGPPLNDFVRLDWPEPRCSGRVVEGAVVYLDRFGNGITNIDAAAMAMFQSRQAAVFAGRKRLCPVADCYAAVSAGLAVAVLGSSGFLEVAVNGGNAALRLGLKVGSKLTVRQTKATA